MVKHIYGWTWIFQSHFYWIQLQKLNFMLMKLPSASLIFQFILSPVLKAICLNFIFMPPNWWHHFCRQLIKIPQVILVTPGWGRKELTSPNITPPPLCEVITTSKTQFAVTIDPPQISDHWGHNYSYHWGSQLQLSLGSQVLLPLTPLDTTMLLLTSLLQAVCLHDNDLSSF